MGGWSLHSAHSLQSPRPALRRASATPRWAPSASRCAPGPPSPWFAPRRPPLRRSSGRCSSAARPGKASAARAYAAGTRAVRKGRRQARPAQVVPTFRWQGGVRYTVNRGAAGHYRCLAEPTSNIAPKSSGEKYEGGRLLTYATGSLALLLCPVAGYPVPVFRSVTASRALCPAQSRPTTSRRG